jgi:cell wall-associated NlpC family hydrolase
VKHEVAQEVGDTLIARAPAAEAMAQFVAKRIKSTSTRGNVNQVELAGAITEIEEETEILGPNYVKVHVIDPLWTLQNSGFVDVDPVSGLLDEIEIEFPQGSKRHWILCDIEGSTETVEGNFILIFQDKLFADLKAQWTPKFAPPGTQTRAQFVRDLLEEAGVPFVIPGVNIVQEVEPETKGESGQTTIEGELAKHEKEAKANKTPGVAAGTGAMIKGAKPTTQQLADVNTALSVAHKLHAPPVAVEALIVAGIAESDFKREAEEKPGTTAGNHYDIWQSSTAGQTTAWYAEYFLKGGEGGFQGGGAIAQAKTPGITPQEIAHNVEAGPPAAFYEPYLQEAKDLIQAGGGTSATVTEAKSDVGQLKRGTDSNPDEDSGECIKRLASQVDWFAFSDGYRFYYMDGPEIAKQVPSLTVEIPRNRIVTRNGTVEGGVLLQPSTYCFDQTTFEYQRDHKIRKKTQRRSRAVKPTSPSEVKLRLVCEIGAHVAGEVILYKKSGPVSSVGRWIVAQTTRKCFKDTYTEIICQPPLQPLPEPKESSKEEVPASEGSGGGASEQAKTALAERSKYVYSEEANRSNKGTLFGPEPRTMDCSSFVTLSYKAASLPDPSNKNYEPIGDTSTLIANCEKVSTPTKDDLCFFGPSESETVHVTIYVGGGKAIAMQAPGITLGEGEAKTFGPGNFLGYYRPKNY